MIGKLNLSDSYIEVLRGSEAELDLDISSFSASTFDSESSPRKLRTSQSPKQDDEEEVFMVENQPPMDSDEDYYEEPDTSCSPPPLQSATVLEDVTNNEEVPAGNVEKLKDLSEPSVTQIEETYGFSLGDAKKRCSVGGRGIQYTSQKITRSRRQLVFEAREILHCGGVVAARSTGALSHPAHGWCTYCQQGIDRQVLGS